MQSFHVNENVRIFAKMFVILVISKEYFSQK
jgi:hypothetical protein